MNSSSSSTARWRTRRRPGTSGPTAGAASPTARTDDGWRTCRRCSCPRHVDASRPRGESRVSKRPDVQAAGALVWRLSASRRLEVLLVHRPRYDDWAWPKGKVEPGETVVECAVREVAEETGVHVALGQPLPGGRHKLQDGRRKHTHYWAAQALPDGAPPTGGRIVEPADETEVDEVRWVEAGEAWRMLTYERDREPLGHFLDQW